MRERDDPYGWTDEQLERAGGVQSSYLEAVRLVERVTGLALTNAWLLETPRPVFLVPGGSGSIG